MRSEHELRGNHPSHRGSVSGDDGTEILLSEFARQVKRIRINVFDICLLMSSDSAQRIRPTGEASSDQRVRHYLAD
jgi:hypothetical protein